MPRDTEKVKAYNHDFYQRFTKPKREKEKSAKLKKREAAARSQQKNQKIAPRQPPQTVMETGEIVEKSWSSMGDIWPTPPSDEPGMRTISVPALSSNIPHWVTLHEQVAELDLPMAPTHTPRSRRRSNSLSSARDCNGSVQQKSISVDAPLPPTENSFGVGRQSTMTRAAFWVMRQERRTKMLDLLEKSHESFHQFQKMLDQEYLLELSDRKKEDEMMQAVAAITDSKDFDNKSSQPSPANLKDRFAEDGGSAMASTKNDGNASLKTASIGGSNGNEGAGRINVPTRRSRRLNPDRSDTNNGNK